jgi:acetyl esterase/lipase
MTTEFIDNGWSMKKLHKIIMTSSAYRQSSEVSKDAVDRDADNVYLSHFNRRRLAPEEIRDTMLQSSGVLNLKMGGRPVVPEVAREELYGLSGNGMWVPTANQEEHTRRSIYMLVRRTFRPAMFESFDAPDGIQSCSRRVESNTAPQSLTLLNGQWTVKESNRLAEKLDAASLIAAMAPFGLAELPEAAPVDSDSPLEALLDYVNVAEAGFEGLFGLLASELAPVQGVTSSVEVIRGMDGNDITLFIHRPDHGDAPLPGVLHLHGGGMVLLEAAGPGYARWRDELAATGLVVVGVEFRNGGGKHGSHAFPAGLNDCASALAWVSDNMARLGISKIVVSGESGGGNLTLATAIRAKRDGRLDQIAGVYAQCPYISNAYTVKRPELPSLYENDGYFLRCDMMGVLARIYSPTGVDDTNPLAWPYHATIADLEGLPPHVISVNQLDPLRDEGLAYYRKLLDAGVATVSRTVNGTSHAADCIFRAAMPEVFLATIRDIKSFADSL